ncbi:MAG: hypothetical protein HY812_09820 [Planctomycetes bacterium]|nr:hypothetical protein [Planctomycetota bacterium]
MHRRPAAGMLGRVISTARSRPILLAALLPALAACSLFTRSSEADLRRVESFGAGRVAGAVGNKLVAHFAPGTEVYSFDHEEGGITVAVTEVENDYDRLRIVAHLTLRSRFAEELRFTLADVRLDYRGVEYGAQDAALWREKSGLKPGVEESRSWAFPIGTWVDAGIYQVTIRAFHRSVDGRLAPVAFQVAFPIKVPGEKRSRLFGWEPEGAVSGAVAAASPASGAGSRLPVHRARDERRAALRGVGEAGGSSW